jgi:hypothetical protein
MRGLCRLALAALFVAACGGENAITNPDTKPLPPKSVFEAVGVDPTTGAKIETDLDDYSPGQIVHLTGSGWAPNEAIGLVMAEAPERHADVTGSVVADANGAFSLDFYVVQLSDDGVTFTLTATGPTSGSVVTVIFTDGTPTVNSFTVNATTFTFPPSPPSAVATNPITVTPGAVVAVVVNASTVAGSPGNADWRSTQVAVNHRTNALVNFGTTALCDEFDVHTLNTAVAGLTRTVNYTMPSTPGTYDIRVRADRTDGCSGGGALTYNGAIIVSAPPANVGPIVYAGDDKSVVEGTPISLGGTGGATATDADSDPLTYAWTIDKTTMDAGGNCVFGPGTATDLTPSITCDDDSNAGTIKLTLTVDDGQGHVVSDFLLLTVTNANPAATATGGSGAEGSPIQLGGAGNDPGDHDDPVLTFAWSVTPTGIDAGGVCNLSSASAQNPTVTCTDDGNFTVSLIVSDDDGGSSVASTANLTVSNANPAATATGGSGAEGSAIQLGGAGNDPGDNDDATLTFAWSVTTTGIDAGGVCNLSSASAQNPTVTCTDDGNFTVSLIVSDDDGGSSVASTANLTVSNAAPSVTITSPADFSLISLLNGAITVTSTYSDAGSNDTHQCQVELDGVIDVVNAYSAVSGGACSRTILPAEAGLYDLTVRIRDDDGDVGSATINIIVYDPSAGFVTGGGWINSPSQAYKADLNLTGKANFGFVSKYKRGATVPEGNTEFQFHAGNLNFHSSSYDFLIVNQAGTNAQFKGKGKINGAGNYTFMLWATDGGSSNDKFRIQITDDDNAGAVVYDNGGSGGTEQLIAGGSIVIHTGSKK